MRTINRSRLNNLRRNQPLRYYALQYGAVLTGGLVVFIPLLDWVAARLLATPAIYSVAFGMSTIGVIYTVLLVRTREFTLGMYVSLIVLSTFAANVPFASPGVLSQFPGDIGPQLWLFEMPLAVLVFYFLAFRRSSIFDNSATEYLFAGFILWIFISIVLSSPPRVDSTVWFGLRMVVGLVAFAVSVRAVRQGIINYSTALQIFCLTVAIQACFSLIQAWAGHSFRLSVLGETAIQRRVPVYFGMFDWIIPAIPGGFTGYGYILGSLILLAAPIYLAYIFQVKPADNIILTIAFIAMVLSIRLASSDSLRGGFIVTLLMFIIGGAWAWVTNRTASLRDFREVRKSTRVLVVLSMAALSVVLFPASRISRSAVDSKSETRGEPIGTSTPPSTPTTNPQDPETTGLGIRVDQYEAGLEAFFKHPISGIGLGNFQYVSAEYGPVAIKGMAIHNVYIGLLAETGLVGFILYLGAILSVLYAGWNLARRGGENVLLNVSVLAGIVGYLGFAFWTHTPIDRVTSFVPFWIICGLIVGKYHKMKRATPG